MAGKMRGKKKAGPKHEIESVRYRKADDGTLISNTDFRPPKRASKMDRYIPPPPSVEMTHASPAEASQHLMSTFGAGSGEDQGTDKGKQGTAAPEPDDDDEDEE